MSRPSSTRGWFVMVGACLALSCGPAESPLERARALQARGRFGESEPLLRSHLAREPGDREASYRLGLALVRSGQADLAAWHLARASEDPQLAVAAGNALASALLSTGNAHPARDAADRVLEVEPGNPEALVHRARAALRMGDADTALADTERLLSLESPAHSAPALELRFRALLALDRIEEAEAVLGTLAESPGVMAARTCVARSRLERRREALERAAEVLEGCASQLASDEMGVRYAVELFDEVNRRETANAVLRDAAAVQPANRGLRALLAERLRAEGASDEADELLVDAATQSGGAADWLLVSDFRWRAGDPASARPAFERALALAGDGDEVLRFRYAELLIELGELDHAERIEEGLSQSLLADLIRGRILLERGDAAEALEAIERAVRLWPDNPGARFLAGHAAEALGDWARALSEYRESVRADPRATDAALALARLYGALGQRQAALDFATIYARSHPIRPQAWVELRRAATRAGREEAARQALRKLGALEGAEGIALVERISLERELAGAAAAVRAVESSDVDLSAPESEPALRLAVECLLEAGRAPEALEWIRSLLERRPGSPALWDIRGRLLHSTGDLEAARGAFERALGLDADYAPGLAGLARVDWAEGHADSATALLDRAAELDPGDPDHAYAAARILLESGRSTDAEIRLRALLERHPYHAAAGNDLAWFLAERSEELDLALALARRAARFDPSPQTDDTLGWVLFQRGEYAEAEEALQRAVDAAPSSPEMRQRLELARAEVERLRGAGDRGAP